MFSDSYKMKLIDEVLYEVYGKVENLDISIVIWICVFFS